MEDTDFKNVDRNFPLCFISDCPSYGICLRALVAQQATQEEDAHLCVLPQARQGDRCKLFLKNEKTHIAYGFAQSFDKVLKKDFTLIRKELTNYFKCKRTYYWYLHGERPLMPEHQAQIEKVFASYGYEGAVVYDRTEEAYVMEVIPY